MEKYGFVPKKDLEKTASIKDGKCPKCGAELVTANPPICPNCGSLPLEKSDGKDEK